MLDFSKLLEPLSETNPDSDFIVPPMNNKSTPVLVDRGVKVRVMPHHKDRKAARILSSDGEQLQGDEPLSPDELRAFALGCIRVAAWLERRDA